MKKNNMAKQNGVKRKVAPPSAQISMRYPLQWIIIIGGVFYALCMLIATVILLYCFISFSENMPYTLLNQLQGIGAIAAIGAVIGAILLPEKNCACRRE